MPFKPDRINIHELTIEEPEKPSELPFDPEKDITEEDWEKINHELKERDKHNASWQAGEFAVAAKILSDGRSEDTPNVAESLRKVFEECRLENSWQRFAGHAGKFKIIAPSRADEIKIAPAERQRMENELLGEINPWIGNLDDAVGLKILFPETNFRGLLNKEDYNSFEKRWREEKDRIEIKDYPSKDPYHFFEKIAQFRLLGFEFAENVTFTEKQWDYIHDLLNQLRTNQFGGNFYKLCQFAANLKIITAQRVEITNKGIEITMQKPRLTSGVPPLPETKQF